MECVPDSLVELLIISLFNIKYYLKIAYCGVLIEQQGLFSITCMNSIAHLDEHIDLLTVE